MTRDSAFKWRLLHVIDAGILGYLFEGVQYCDEQSVHGESSSVRQLAVYLCKNTVCGVGIVGRGGRVVEALLEASMRIVIVPKRNSMAVTLFRNLALAYIEKPLYD